jgi:hypothetical protein
VTEHSDRKPAAATGNQAAWILPGLRELLGLLGKLAEPLPYPADVADYPGRRDLEDRRHVLLQARMISLADQLAVSDRYPKVAAECLARHCENAAGAVREQLAVPLGYEPEAESPEAGQ